MGSETKDSTLGVHWGDDTYDHLHHINTVIQVQE